MCRLLWAYFFEEMKTPPNMGVHRVALDVLFPVVPYFATQFNHMLEGFQLQYSGLLASFDQFWAILGRFWGPDRPKVGPRGSPPRSRKARARIVETH